MIGKFSLIILSLFAASVFARSEVRIISSDRNSITIEYSPDYSDTSFVNINNINYLKINFRNGIIPDRENWGMPSVPVAVLNIGVPSEYGNTIEILGSVTSLMDGLVAPNPKPVKHGISFSYKYELNPDYNSYSDSPEIVSFDDFGYIRNLPVQSIRISPVKFDPLNRKITLYKTIRFRINFAGNQKIASKASDDFAAASILNFDAAKYWVRERKAQSLRKTVFNSVLANGTWYKFEAPDEGIYKITYAMLSSYGIDPATVDPRTIKIYNNSGKPLPENPLDPRPADLQENAIVVSGEDDGKFDEGDYILFYGRGNNFWDYDTTSHSFKRIFNVYTDHNYYWITSGGAPGKRAEDKSSLNESNIYSQNSSKGFLSRDDDKINILNSGRQFLGDDFTDIVRSRTYVNKLDGRINSVPVEYHLRFVTASPNPTAVDVEENNTNIWHRNMPAGVSELIDGTAYSATVFYNAPIPENRSNLKFIFTPNSSSAKAYLDYFEIIYQKELKAFNNYLLFYSKDTTAVIEYHLTGFTNSNIRVYDVSDYAGMKEIKNFTMLSGSECRFQVSEQQGKVSRYIAVTSDNFKTPVNPQEASNSNIHGISDGAKYLIITHKNFMEAANRLKNYRENQAKHPMSTIVVDIDDVFNEFAGGLPDVTGIRDFIKYAFDNWQTAPEYVLFFGAGNYDYKDILGYHTNYLPPYETIESLSEIGSYTTDDYFVNLDADQKVDLATGRITCKTLEAANNVVDKIIYYENSSDKGLWRNLITLVADDGYQGADYQTQAEDFTGSSEILSSTYIPGSYNFKKLYMAAFPIVLTGNGKRIPAGNKAIISAMNEGTLIVNYVGHGAPYVWADESIFEQGVSIPQLNNDRYFFLSAATCDFGYFDDPAFTSSAEDLLLDNTAGAIGTLSSSRPVFQLENEALMYEYFSQLMKPGGDSTRGIPIGKAMYFTKQVQGLNGQNARKFFIFGDPTLRLLDPGYDAVIDSINGEQVTDGIQIKALSHTRISGSIIRPDSSLWSDFNGEGTLEVFDSKRIETLQALRDFKITRQGGIIFKGRVSVNSGKFNADFVVPKDISYQDQNGKIVFYFYDPAVDGLGYTNQIIVGGTDTSTVNDGKGPDIDIYFDNASAVNSNLINPNSTLVVKLSDETGLNTTGTGIGHQLEGVLNDQEENPIDLTQYFTGDLDAGGKSGEVNYKFNGLEQGDYSLLVKAWDVFNNFNSQTVYFTVVSGDDLEIRDVYNYPNPFSNNTTFTFQRNRTDDAEVRIKIYTVSGRLIREIEKYHTTDKFVRVEWDGRDQDGNVIANGTYLYKIIVKNLDGNFTKSVLGKLAVIR
jgi:hypothetical protein